MSDQAPTDDLAAQLRGLQSDLDALKESLKQAGRRGASSALDGAEAYARGNPLTVIAGAVGFGVVLGLMLRRR